MLTWQLTEWQLAVPEPLLSGNGLLRGPTPSVAPQESFPQIGFPHKDSCIPLQEQVEKVENQFPAQTLQANKLPFVELLLQIKPLTKYSFHCCFWWYLFSYRVTWVNQVCPQQVEGSGWERTSLAFGLPACVTLGHSLSLSVSHFFPSVEWGQEK